MMWKNASSKIVMFITLSYGVLVLGRGSNDLKKYPPLLLDINQMNVVHRNNDEEYLFKAF